MKRGALGPRASGGGPHIGKGERRRLTLLMVLLALVACGESGRPGSLCTPGTIQPGDGLLDDLSRARFGREPGSGLPAGMATPGADGFVLATPVIPSGAWRRVDAVPEGWRSFLEQHHVSGVWRAALPATPSPAAGAVRVLWDGVEQPPWSPGPGPLPRPFAWWDPALALVFALGGEAPTGLSLELPVDPVAELGPVLPGGPDPLGHLGAFELGDVSRRALLMPPPGVLELEVADLRAERLHLSLAVLDKAWALFGGVLHRTTGRSDGARFAVEVSLAGRTERVYERTLTRDDVGKHWVDDVVDLSAYRGRRFTLRLLSEAGDGGEAAFDWALWGDLRFRGGTPEPPSRPHVVLIQIDTLRADRVGGSRRLTPRIDAWAERHAARFEDALSSAPWTLPSTVSLFTGLDVRQHGVERHSQVLPDRLQTLAERLLAAGYETWGLEAGGYLRPSFGMAQGFERYQTVEPENLDWSSALAFVRRRDSSRPVFLFLHTYYVHAPYPADPRAAPAGYSGRFAGQDVDYDHLIGPFRKGELELSPDDLAYIGALYDAQVRTMDASLGDLLEQLEATLAEQGLLLVLTSDHGECLGEHHQLEHGHALWQELLSVPLLVRFPDGRPATRSDPASLVDVLPTVLDVLGLPAEGRLAGTSLRARQPPDRMREARCQAEQSLSAVIWDGLKRFDSDSGAPRGAPLRRYFELRGDPGEQHPLDQIEPGRAAALERRLQAMRQAHPPLQGEGLEERAGLDRELSDQLRALGYLGDG